MAQRRLIGGDGVKAESVNTWSRANKRTGEIVMTLQQRNERLGDTAGEAGEGGEKIAANAAIIMSVQPRTKAKQVAGRWLQRAKDTARRRKRTKVIGRRWRPASTPLTK